jgi:hypothetical protein
MNFSSQQMRIAAAYAGDNILFGFLLGEDLAANLLHREVSRLG